MLTKNNWLHTNLADRFTNPASDFYMSVRLYPFQEMSFQAAADYTCLEIAKDYDNFFLAFSGGMDSDFVLRCFHRNKIHIKPVIVACGNEIENEYAYRLCDELKISPIIIKVTEEEFLYFYREHIYEKFNGVGYNSTHVLIASQFVQNEGGTLITGNHFIGDGDDMICDRIYLMSNEWDFYTAYCFPGSRNIDFFLYTPEIAYAIMPNENITWNKHKEKIYEIQYRDKMRPVYTDETVAEIKRMARNRAVPLKRTGEVWSKQNFINTFNKYKL
jgi:hypothetical protein